MTDRDKEPLAERAVPLDDYSEVQPLLRHVRIMERFFDEVVDENPQFRKHYSDLHVAYMRILAEELAPHALPLALAITELEDAYPDIASKGEIASKVESTKSPRIEMVKAVTMDHGAAFARHWSSGDDMPEACEASEIMTWPDTDREAQGHYHDLENEICDGVFEATNQQIAEAFARVANGVLDRERRRSG